jgi:hypothetical protein
VGDFATGRIHLALQKNATPDPLVEWRESRALSERAAVWGVNSLMTIKAVNGNDFATTLPEFKKGELGRLNHPASRTRHFGPRRRSDSYHENPDGRTISARGVGPSKLS